MILATVKIFGSNLIFASIVCLLGHAVCPVDDVIIRGQVGQPPRNAKVRIQLVYAREMPGESADTTLDGPKFTLAVDFLTQSRKPLLNGAFEKCGRRPETVTVTLLDGEGSRKYDRVSLPFRNFKMTTPSTYTWGTEVLLKGP